MPGVHPKSPPQATDPAQTEILRIQSGRESETYTGIMSTIFPANYPSFGISFGIAESSGRSLSYFTGLAWRILGKQNSAVMTVTAGAAAIPVQRYPGISREELGIEDGMPWALPTTSPLLNGEVRYEGAAFIAITLGYGLDRRGSKDAP